MCKRILSCFLFVFFLPLLTYADSFEPQASYSVCFSPDQDCTSKIVQAINDAKCNIWVQAYSFTSRPIGKALVLAKKRGVNVQIIFDKSALSRKQGAINYFARYSIPIWIDKQPAIAHNKVMILDQTKIITGSFNFTYAAQKNNAENVLLINDSGLAKQYLKNWQNRQQLATSFIYTRQPQENSLEHLSGGILQWVKSWF